MKTAVLFFVAVFFASCTEPPPPKVTDPSVPDQCLRREIFQQCLTSVPKGPEHVGVSNDWDEVIAKCGEQAYYISFRKQSSVRVECRS